MKKIRIVILVLLIMLAATSCDKPQQMYKASFLKLFDTVTEIAGYADNEKDYKKFAQLIYDNLEQYHQLYDIYNDYDGINNIKTINDNAGVKPVKVDKEIIDLLLFSKKAYQLTDGKVNIAFGSVLQIWHTYREDGINNPEEAKLPPIKDLKDASHHTDIDNLIIDEKKSTVFLKDKDMRLDVGAVAKGYATEQVAQIAINKGYHNFLLSVGGNVRSVGIKQELKINKIKSNPTTKQLWQVGIQNPDTSSEQKSLYTMGLTNLSLVSSGVYERYYTVNGKQYHHLIDPVTLMPTNYFTQVTILCEDSGLADALSTAVFLLPYEDGKALIDSIDGVSAMWVMADGTEKFSDNFKKYITSK